MFIFILLLFPVSLFALTDQETLALTIAGEARGEGEKGMLAVANVIVNRYNADKRYVSISEVCRKPKQFSFWNETVDLEKVKKDKAFTYANDLAAKIISKSKVTNLVKASQHYCRVDCFPKWRDDSKVVAIIGQHVFFRL